MLYRIDAVAGGAPWRVLPVESTQTKRRQPREERRRAPRREPGATFRPGGEAPEETAYALEKAIWERAVAARHRKPR